MSRRVVGNRGVFSSASLLAVADFLTNIYQTNGIRSIENAPLRYVQGHVIPLRIRIERVNNHNQLIRAFPILISNLYYLSGTSYHYNNEGHNDFRSCQGSNCLVRSDHS